MTTQPSKRSKTSGVPDPKRAAALIKRSQQRLAIARAAAATATADLLDHGIPVVYAENGKVYRRRPGVSAPEFVRDLPPSALAGSKRKK